MIWMNLSCAAFVVNSGALFIRTPETDCVRAFLLVETSPEPLLNRGDRHYNTLREIALEWMGRAELDTSRIDHPPSTFSGGMQQRVQIARSLVHGPKIVFHG